MTVPHPLRDYAGLALSEAQDVLFGLFEIRSHEHVNGAFEEIQQFVLFGMHFPLVSDTRRLNREHTNLSTIQLCLQKVNRWSGASHGLRIRCTHALRVYISTQPPF